MQICGLVMVHAPPRQFAMLDDVCRRNYVGTNRWTGTTKKCHQAMQTKGVRDPVIYYRVALRSERSSLWQWRSSTLTSMSSVFDVLKASTSVPRTTLRVFFSSSSVCLDEMLISANDGMVSISVTAEQFLRGEHMSPAEMKRLALEMHTEGDYDSSYLFTLPANMQQVLAWTKLLTRVHNGELKP